jgi:hypothetical protein
MKSLELAVPDNLYAVFSEDEMRALAQEALVGRFCMEWRSDWARTRAFC